MDKKDAIKLIETIINSIEQEPAQFHIEVSVIGQQISSSGGIGLQISATGGGPGSTTIGQSVSTGNAQLKFAHKTAIQGMEQQTQALLNALRGIVEELNKPSPEKSKIRGMLNTLKESWVPPLIVSIVTHALIKSIGL